MPDGSGTHRAFTLAPPPPEYRTNFPAISLTVMDSNDGRTVTLELDLTSEDSIKAALELMPHVAALMGPTTEDLEVPA